MKRGGKYSFVCDAVPGAAAAVVGGGLWLGVAHTKGSLMGWVLLMVVGGTVAGIFAGARARNWRRGGWACGFLAVMLTIVLICVVGMEEGVAVAWRMAAVVVSWVGLWCAVGWGLRRWGPGVSVGVTLAAAAWCMALPVAAMPVVRGVGTGSAWQGRMVVVMARACPFFPVMSALKPAVRVDWGALPGMYAWSGLGQEVPLELPGAWACAGMYVGGAMLMVILSQRMRGQVIAMSI